MNEIDQEAERIVAGFYGDRTELSLTRDSAKTIALSAFAAGMKHASAPAQPTQHVPGKVCICPEHPAGTDPFCLAAHAAAAMGATHAAPRTRCPEHGDFDAPNCPHGGSGCP